MEADGRQQTREMVVGSLVNDLLLMERTDHIVEVDVGSRNAKKFKEADGSHPEADGWIVCTSGEYNDAVDIAGAITAPASPAATVARYLLMEADGIAEYAWQWLEDVGDEAIECKLMADRLINHQKLGPVHVELKTARDPSPEAFARQAYQLGYHCQAAFYRRGLAHLLDLDDMTSIMVVVRNSPPYDVAVYQWELWFLMLGEEQVEKDLERLARCMSGEQEYLADWERLPEGDIPVLEAPRWAR
jgi:hypothetical protein